MLYNSDNFAVVQFEVEAPDAGVARLATAASAAALKRGGYEIVDKHARREIFIEGAAAESFKVGVQALISAEPGDDEIDEYLEGYTVLAQQPVVLH
jgi:hypothetical protein